MELKSIGAKKFFKGSEFFTILLVGVLTGAPGRNQNGRRHERVVNTGRLKQTSWLLRMAAINAAIRNREG